MKPGDYLSSSSSFKDESYWILSGELRLEVDYDERHILRAGDRAFLPARAIRSIEVPGNVPVVYLIGAKKKEESGQSYVGEIRIFAGGSAPQGWAFCKGQLLPINSYKELFSLVGTAYGGDGRVSFALPDLRGRVPMHQGCGRSTGDKGSVGFTNAGFDYSDWSGSRTASGFLVTNYMISLDGVFPSADDTSLNVVPLLAEGRIFAFNFAPHGWASCDGQLLALGKVNPSENTGLFSLLGTTYARDELTDPDSGWTPFALPDLRGLIPLHNTSVLGKHVGQEDGISQNSFVGLKGVINFLAINCCIALGGVFPSPPRMATEDDSTAGQPFIAEVRIFFGNFAPNGWALCEGQLLPIQEHQELFSLIGTTYGGDGAATFALPDLRQRAPLQAGGLRTYAEMNQEFCEAGEKGGGDYIGRNLDQKELTATIEHLSNAVLDHIRKSNLNLAEYAKETMAGRFGQAGNALEAAVKSLESVEKMCVASQEQSAQRRKDSHGFINQKMTKIDESPFIAVNFIIALRGRAGLN